jgi:TPR repeat protein
LVDRFRAAQQINPACGCYYDNVYWITFAGMATTADAADWWRKAADGGDLRALYALGALFHKRGELDNSEKWWRRAANAGQADAKYALGVVQYERGDAVGAEFWWRQAANQGDHDAEYLGGLAFAKRDIPQAIWWWRRAAEAGDLQAQSNLESVLSEQGDVGQAEPPGPAPSAARKETVADLLSRGRSGNHPR